MSRSRTGNTSARSRSSNLLCEKRVASASSLLHVASGGVSVSGGLGEYSKGCSASFYISGQRRGSAVDSHSPSPPFAAHTHVYLRVLVESEWKSLWYSTFVVGRQVVVSCMNGRQSVMFKPTCPHRRRRSRRQITVAAKVHTRAMRTRERFFSSRRFLAHVFTTHETFWQRRILHPSPLDIFSRPALKAARRHL